MSKKVSRISLWLLATGTLAIVSIVVSVQRSATANNRQQVNVNLDNEVQRQYKEMGTLSPEARRNVFRAASAYGKSALWRIHFAEYQKAHPELTLGQIRVIEEASILASPFLFGLPENEAIRDAVVGKAMQELKEHALAVFPQDEARKLFAQLGPIETSSSLSAFSNCGCYTVQGWWCSSGYCRPHEYTGCTTSTWGCGSLWAQPCNGDCSGQAD